MRARLVRALLALALPLTAIAAATSSAQAAGNYPTPGWVSGQKAGTCFAGSSQDPTCTQASRIATDFRLAGLAQTNAILAAQPQLDQNEVNCPGAMWLRDTLVSRINATAFTTRYRLSGGISVSPSPLAVPSGFYPLLVHGSSAYSLLTSLYQKQLHGEATAVGWVSLAYNFTPAGAPRASGTPGTLPLPTTAPAWKPPVAVRQALPLVLFDLGPAKVHVTLGTPWNDPVAGHGVFIRSLAEAAFGVGQVPLVDVTDGRGLYSEASIARALDGYAFAPGSIASLSSGTYQCTISKLPAPPLMLADAVRVLRTEGVHLVAAAGNDAITSYFYPAAYDEVPVPLFATGSCPPSNVYDPFTKLCSANLQTTVTGVGSLTDLPGALTSYSSSSKAPVSHSEFTNYGTWVKAWADGDQVVGSYTDGPFRYCIATATTCDLGDGSAGIPLSDAPTAHLGSSVMWSGTSFAAPMVAIWLAAGNPAP
jgi:hypothetical protein